MLGGVGAKGVDDDKGLGIRNGRFRQESIYTGANPPTGRNTPEYWGGRWGVGECVSVHNARRTAEAKFARGARKNERRNKIGANATDTAGGGRFESKLGSFWISEWGVGNAKTPELALRRETIACSNYGSQFPHLAQTGDHYATKKYLMAELMEKLKETNCMEYQGHLAEYNDLYMAYQDERRRRYTAQRLLHLAINEFGFL